MQNTIKVTPIIIAGGSGTRLWPVSRKSMPKQFCKIAGDNSLFQKTLNRVANKKLFNAPVIVSGEEHCDIIEAQMSEVGSIPRAIICEPIGRDTAPAIALAASALDEKHEDIMLVLPSDHLIEDQKEFENIVEQASLAAVDGKSIITFGIKPTHPDTGFGYIRAGDKRGALPVHDLDIFIEKPDLELAEELVQDKSIYWNAGIFMFHPALIRNELKRYAPDMSLQIMTSICHGKWKERRFYPDRWIFEGIKPISFDYAIMEKTDHAAIAKADINWSDMGSWDAVWEKNQRDPDNNALVGETYCEDTKDSLILSDGPAVAVSGLKDVVVVAQNDAVLVTTRHQTQSVKSLVGKISPKNAELLENHMARSFKWGEIMSLHKSDTCGVTLIRIDPYSELSSEDFDAEYKSWFVKSGRPVFSADGTLSRLAPNQQVSIKPDMIFQMLNSGDEAIEIIEIRHDRNPSFDRVPYFEPHPDSYGSSFAKSTEQLA